MKNLNFVSVRMITAHIQSLVQFYEHISKQSATWLTDDFAEIQLGSFTLAIASTRTLGFFGQDMAQPAANKSMILEFILDDVDAAYENIKTLNTEIVQVPTTMSWGNRSLLFRDPDGNLVNFFTPVSEQAKKKFAVK